MGCEFIDFGRGDNGSKRVVIRLLRGEILYDVQNYCYIEGSLLGKDIAPHIKHTVEDSGDEGNVDRVLRVLNLCVAQCREMLYPYCKREIRDEEYDDRLRSPKVYGIVMDVPEGVSETTIKMLREELHEYLVSRVVADWMSITNPGKADVWYMKSKEMEEEIRTALATRRGGISRALSVF